MNRHERDDLLKFLQPLLRTRAVDKDFAAETLILEQCARQPDALYLLVQRAMALESALQAAQARIADPQGALAAHADAGRDAGLVRAEPGDRSGGWGRGLLAQAGTIGTVAALGVTVGVVTGGLLLDAAEDAFGDDL